MKAELAARQTPGAVVKRLGGLKQMASLLTGGGLPRPVRALVEEAFSATGYERNRILARRDEAILDELTKYSPEDWKSAIRTLLPHLLPSADAACRTLASRPYQTGIARKPFRCPRSRAQLARTRGRWLLNVTVLLGEYDADITWVAEWAAHLASWWGGADLGWLLAGAIDLGGPSGARVEEILEAAATGEHETAQMGRHVTQAFLSSSKPGCWEFVQRLLLSAQRQEGLRQVILESIDEAHPQAFRRFLRLIREENLSRFSAVVRAADVWFGFMWDGASAVKVDALLDRVLLFLDDPAARHAALDEKDAEVVYLALWSIAFEDVDAAIEPAGGLLASPSEAIRFVATHFLVQCLWSSAVPPLVDMLADPDLRVAARALDMFGTPPATKVDKERLFDQVEQLLKRVPQRSQMLDALVWPWWKRKLERSTIAAVLASNASAVPGERLLPYVPDLDPAARAGFIRRAAGLRKRWEPADERKPRKLSAGERTVALGLLGDPSADVREAAFQALHSLPLQADEVDRLIELLGRRPGDLRNGALKRLRSLSDSELLAAAERLLSDPDELRRLAGLELLRDAAEAGRVAAQARDRMQRYTTDHPTMSAQDRAHASVVLGETKPLPGRDDALGLLGPGKLASWPAVRPRQVEVQSPGAQASLESLALVVLERQGTEIRTPSGEMKHLVESVVWTFGPRKREDLETSGAAVPLAAVWQSWLGTRPSNLRDRDGCEFLRILLSDENGTLWKSGAPKQVAGIAQWSAGTRFLRGLCEWCVAWEPPAGGVDFLLDGLEDRIAGFTSGDYRGMKAERASGPIHYSVYGEQDPPHRRSVNLAERWLGRLRWWRDLFPASIQPRQAIRFYGLLRSFETRSGGYRALRLTLEDFLGTYRAGAVGEVDFVDLLVGRWSYQPGSSMLRFASTRKPAKALAEHPELPAVVDRCRRRVVEIETQRGDRETAASGLAMELRSTGGLETLARAVPALGKTHFARHFSWSESGASRQETLSHLVIRSLPREEDTVEAFAAWAAEAGISEARLVELAVYAPQWARHVNHVLEWPGLESAVWWFQAHTKDDRSWQLQEMKAVWAAEVSERTPLSAMDLTEGAVDVAWFTKIHAELGPERLKKLDTAAKYAASAAGHTRAQLFARAMAGVVAGAEITGRMDGSRHQDSVRALGLLPLAAGRDGQGDLLERYQRLEEFRRQSRKFGSQRQQSEKRAVTIGLENLARTAGFRDPQRLQWAMEQQAVADLGKGPLVVTRAEVTLTLSIDAEGQPGLSVARSGKPLKALPPALKKDAGVEELRGRYQDLKRQRSRVRNALEEAMCRGDRFSAGELRGLLEHPILAPGLSRIVFVGDGVAGYLAEGGRALRDQGGKLQPVSPGEELRVAHPQDLLLRGDWTAWQRECYRAERVQPFKQLFRELYPITEAERGTERSRRYAGHQVNPRQALALLGGRGWVARPEEGVSRTFHEEGLTARLGFQEAFFTPADIEGLTLEEVIFTPKGEWKELGLDGIPARLFSETMRDLDLVVSVAHQGGVDPEATASTVEMRAALIRETCELLELGNVELQKHHAMIHGSLGAYSVHLGSAVAMLMPGTALPIVAVHSQHRGRLFLPFADDDPRTAEVLSKVLLLARDGEIRDPNILEWIRAAS
ncbi:MAG TPA: DUF5724 domain-containing protein [Gemmatimonadales bacterium]|nr:DUF5724 domain-containing protein [Gemmatimonadales bacterium]